MSDRRHGISRLEGFSDTVFGFALTLLVASLEPPQSADAKARTGTSAPSADA